MIQAQVIVIIKTMPALNYYKPETHTSCDNHVANMYLCSFIADEYMFREHAR